MSANVCGGTEFDFRVDTVAVQKWMQSVLTPKQPRSTSCRSSVARASGPVGGTSPAGPRVCPQDADQLANTGAPELPTSDAAGLSSNTVWWTVLDLRITAFAVPVNGQLLPHRLPRLR